MRKYKNNLYQDDDFPNYLFEKSPNGKIDVYQKINAYEMRNRNILHFNLRVDKKRFAISEARILTAIEQKTKISDVRYIPNKKSHSQRKKIALIEIIKAKREICEQYQSLYNSVLWDDAIISFLESRDMLSEKDIKSLLFKHLNKAKRKHQLHTQFEKLEYKLQ